VGFKHGPSIVEAIATNLSFEDRISQSNTPNTAQHNSVTTTDASFDCAKASTNTEILICSDVELMHADKEMGDAYIARLHAFPSEREEIQIEQRNWIQLRELKCAQSLPNDERIDCLKAQILDRTEALAQ